MTGLKGYQITDKILETKTFSINRVLEKKTNELQIIKSLNYKQPSRNELEQLQHEYSIVKELDSNGVINFLSIKDIDGMTTIIAEDFDGIPLNRFIKLKKPILLDILQIGINIAKIVGDIHKYNIIHKDIKPGNILIDKDTLELKIIDFSIAVRIRREIQIAINPEKLEGTLAYISPEQTGRMNRSIDLRSDIYSLGVTFYEMFSGRLPFDEKEPIKLVHSHIARMPAPLHEIAPYIPVTISGIVMKMLSKTAEGRYQGTAGLIHDLINCYEQLSSLGKIKPFEPGKRDISNIFQIPEELYGRKNEIEILFDEFSSVSKGETRMLFISGPPGIGKTHLINELQKPLVKEKGYFVSGKFDKLGGVIPFSSFMRAFQDLVSQILTESEKSIAIWKDEILQSVGNNGQIIIDVIPELELIIGPQESVQELLPTETQNRFNHIFPGFVKVFAQKSHPLVLFLDDLQWADNASLNLLHTLMQEKDLNYLMVIGAYRDNEVGSSHQLLLFLDRLNEMGLKQSSLRLNPLDVGDIAQLIKETLLRDSSEVDQMAELIRHKTNGNPFFVKAFLYNLYNEKYITYSNGWFFDIDRILQSEITDNVVELMTARIQKIPGNVQSILKTASCIGVQFELDLLSKISGVSVHQLIEDFNEVLNEGMLIKLDENMKFAHDRVREAAYSLLRTEEKVGTHYNIAKVLLSGSNGENLDEGIFSIVHHYNMAQSMVTSREERIYLANLNLAAGQRSKTSTVYESAFIFFTKGLELLPDDTWTHEYDLTFSLNLESADVSYITGKSEYAERILRTVMENAKSVLDKIRVFEVKIVNYTTYFKTREALQLGREALKLLGINMPGKAYDLNILKEMLIAKNNLRKIDIRDLIDLPEMKDPHKLAAVRILMSCAEPSYIGDPKYLPLVILKLFNFSLKNGNSIYSVFAYGFYGAILCGFFGQIDKGYQLANLSLKILDKYQARILASKVYFGIGTVINHWKDHLQDDIEYLIKSYKCGLETGDLVFASYSINSYIFHTFFKGENFDKLKELLVEYYEVMKKLKKLSSLHAFRLWYQVVLNLSGDSENRVEIKGDIFNEDELTRESDHSIMGFYIVGKLILLYLFDEFEEAIKIAVEGKEYLDGLMGMIFIPEYYFYYSLSLLALYNSADRWKQKKYFRIVVSCQKKMKKWAKHAPMNYQHKYVLIEAEISRVKGKGSKDAGLYEQAIELSRQNGFIQDTAIASELAAKFFLSEGLKTISAFYFGKAHYMFNLWGAKAKVSDLEEKYPEHINLNKSQKLTELQSLNNQTGATFTGTVLQLDYDTVMKASQAISEEIVLESLLEKLIYIMMENAGAMKGVLLLNRDDELFIEGEGHVDGAVKVMQSIPLKNYSGLPKSIIRYVDRVQDSVVLDNAFDNQLFTDDAYIQSKEFMSVMCIPAVHQKKLIAILYLENNLVSGAFTADRRKTLKILAAQAAISLENAMLYKSLTQEIRERKLAEEALHMYRNIVSSSSDQMAFVDTDSLFKAVNDEFVRVVQMERMDILGHSVEEILSKNVFKETFRNYFEKCLSNREITFEKWFVYPDIGRRYMDISLYPFLDSTGVVSGVIMNLRDITDRLKMEKTIVDIREKERQQIGTELHDGLSHFLLGISLKSRALADFLNDSSIPEASQAFEVEKKIKEAIDYTRKLARGIFPVYIDKSSVSKIIEEKSEYLEQRCNILCVAEVDESIKLSDETVITQLYFIIQECIDNIVKHSGAKRVKINFISENNLITLSISDDGVGFEDVTRENCGMGLNIIKYRARLIGASLDTKSSEIDGTEIICQFSIE